ncbi:MAG: hypothetical protein GEU83_11205 [Pseudonocardiaceae bacterium]|nr:hypothetical protein [Pseudonocardiaceae bacterium]
MTTLSTSNRLPTTSSTAARWAAYGAATWALGFAAVNIYLQIVGIDDSQLQQNWAAFTAVNLGVVVLKVFGAMVALATVQRWGRAPPAWLVSVSAWGAAGMLLLYAGYGLVALAAAGELLGWTRAGGMFLVPNLAYLGFFALGGALFAVAARHHQHRTATSPVWAVAWRASRSE